MKRFTQPVESKKEVVVQITRDELVDIAKEACVRTVDKFDLDCDDSEDCEFMGRITAILADFTADICHELFNINKVEKENK